MTTERITAWELLEGAIVTEWGETPERWTEERYRSIDREALARKLECERLDNRDPRQGFALVSVLAPEVFRDEHIPGSINIPLGHEDEFERRFARNKDIVVYCGSLHCDASSESASELRMRGFSNVSDYVFGLLDWKEGGFRTSGTAEEYRNALRTDDRLRLGRLAARPRMNGIA